MKPTDDHPELSDGHNIDQPVTVFAEKEVLSRGQTAFHGKPEV